MQIASIRHKALRRLATKGDRRVMQADRLSDMLAYIAAAESLDDLMVPPNFGFHALTGDRDGSFAMTVTCNWRLTFTMPSAGVVAELDLEDYHGR